MASQSPATSRKCGRISKKAQASTRERRVEITAAARPLPRAVKYPDKKTLAPIKRKRRLKRRRPSQVIAATVSELVNKPIIVGPPKREMARMMTELIAIVIKL